MNVVNGLAVRERGRRLVSAWRQRLSTRTWLVIGIPLLGVAGSALLIATAPANTPEAREEKVWPVSVTTVRLADASPEILLFGRVETPRTASLGVASSFVTSSAEVAEVFVAEGDRVAEGEVLLRLDDRDARLEVARREAEVANARAALASVDVRHAVDETALRSQRRLDALAREKLRRREKLREQDLLSDAGIDEVQREAELQAIELGEISGRVADYPNEILRRRAELALAEAQLEQARLQLERAALRAPFPGRVASVAVAKGERVSPGSEVIEIYDTSALEVRAQIPSQHMASLRGALEREADAGGSPVAARATLDGLPLSLRLDRLAGRVATGRGGVDALFRITSEARGLELGRVLDLYVEMPQERGVAALPIQALYGDSRIYRVEGERLHAIEVDRVGEKRAEEGYQVLVRSPALATGDAVLVTQLPKAIDGLRVSPPPVD